jgi:hypothetical protein
MLDIEGRRSLHVTEFPRAVRAAARAHLAARTTVNAGPIRHGVPV